MINTIPDEDLRYIRHERDDSGIIMHIESIKTEAICPYCGTVSRKVHSRYIRQLQDLPIQGEKVRLQLNNKKYFCINTECRHKTFAEQFTFFTPKSVKTKRLEDEIVRVSLIQSSVSAAKYLRSSIANVGKSTICDLNKKRGKRSECIERSFGVY